METRVTSPPERAGDECPPAEALAAFAEGTASSELRSQLVGHVSRCEDCSAVVSETVRFLDGADAALTDVPRRRPAWVLPLAASIAIALAGAWIMASRRGPAVEMAEQPAVPSAPSSARVPPGVGSARPAWLDDAPWNSAARARLGFAPPGADSRAVLLGLHLGALDQACGLPPGVREPAVRDVERSLVEGGLLDQPRAREAARPAARGDCESPVRIASDGADRVELGRALERWRIALVERDPSALDPARARAVEELVRKLRIGPAGLQLVERLKASTHARPEGGPEVQADLLELIEMLCV